MNSQAIATIREALIVRFNDLDDIIRHGVYAEPEGIQETLVAIDAALAELADLEQAGTWEVVDNLRKTPCSCGNCTNSYGMESETLLTLYSNSTSGVSVVLPDDLRLCRRVSREQAQ